MTALDSSSLSHWEMIANVGAWLVIVGVAGEGFEIALKIIGHRVRNEKFLSWYKKREFSIEVWGAVFWALLVAGLAIELKGGHEAKKIMLRENDRLNLETANAR